MRKKITHIVILSGVLLTLPIHLVVADLTEESSAPTLREKKAKEGYILNIKDLIDKSKNKIEKVNDKLKDQAKMRRNQQREEKAKEYYEKAMAFYDEGDYDAAQKLWEKAVRITENPEMDGYVRESSRKRKKKEKALEQAEKKRLKRLEIERGYSAKEVEKKYQSAVSLFKQEKYIPAKVDFEAIDEMFPDHKATRSYLMLIQGAIEKEQKELIDQKLKKDAFLRKKEKEAWRNQLKQKKINRRNMLDNQAEVLYAEAVSLHRAKHFESAKEKFKEIEWIRPDYKNTVRYLSRIDHDIEKEVKHRAKNNSNGKYDDRSDDYRLNQFFDQEKGARQKRIKEETDFVYTAAVALYKQKSFKEARARFVEVQRMILNYKSTGKYLTIIDRKILEGGSLDRGVDALAKEIRSDKSKGKGGMFGWLKKKDDKSEPTPRFVSQPLYGDRAVIQAIEERNKRLALDAENRYKNAIKAYKSKNYQVAKTGFIQIEALHPGYKDVPKYLDQLAEEMVSASPAKLMQPKMTARLVKQAKQSRQVMPEKEDRFKKEAESQYNQAMALYQQKKYEEAKKKFIASNNLSPNYKKANKHIDKIDGKIALIEKKAKLVAEQEEKRARLIAGKEERRAKLATEKEERRAKLATEKEERAAKLATEKQERTAKLAMKLEEKKAKWVADKEEKKVKKVEAKDEKTRQKSIKKSIDYEKKKTEQGYAKWPKKKVKPNFEKEFSEEKWSKDQDGLVAELKVKEEYLDNLDEKRYEEYQKNLKEEQKALEKSEKERKRYGDKRRRELKKILKAEEKEKKNKKFIARQQDLQQQKEFEKEVKKVEVAKKKKLEREKRERIKLNIEELKRKEEEHKRQAALLAMQIAEELKQQKKEEVKVLDLKYGPLKIMDKMKIHSESYLLDDVKEELAQRQAKKELKRIKKEQDKLLAKQKIIIDAEREKMKFKLNKKTEDEKEQWKEHVKQLYKEAKILFKEGNYAAARNKFSVVEGLHPGYKSAKSYMNKINGMLEREDRAMHKDAYKQTKDKYNDKKKEREQRRNSGKNSNENIDSKTIEVANAGFVNEKTRKMTEKKRYKKEKDEIWKQKKEEIATKKEMKKNLAKLKAEEQSVSHETKHIENILKKEYEVKLKREKRERLQLERMLNSKLKKERDERIKLQKKLDENSVKGLTEDIDKIGKEQLEKIKKDKEKEFKKKIAKEKRKGKEEKKKAKLKAKLEKVKRKQALSRLRSDIEATYQEALTLYEANEIDLSKEKFNQFEKMLSKDELPSKYLTKMRTRLIKDRERIRKKSEVDRRKKEEIARKRKAEFQKEQTRIGNEERKELKALESRIRRDETELALEKRKEQLKHRQMRNKKKELMQKRMFKDKHSNESDRIRELRSNGLSVDEVVRKLDHFDHESAVFSESRQKQAELRDLVKERQRQLRIERDRIRRDFSESLDRLYLRGIDLEKKGKLYQAQRVFTEINAMQPGYKKTQAYLDQLNKSSGSRSSSQSPDQFDSFGRQGTQSVKTKQELIAETLNLIEQNR